VGGKWGRRRRGANSAVDVSVRDMPAVDAFLRCAVPMLHLDDEHGLWHGVGGTAFLVKYDQRLLAVTAGHCLRTVVDHRMIGLPTLAQGPRSPAFTAARPRSVGFVMSET